MAKAGKITDFDHWLGAQFAETGAFTALMVLVEIAEQGPVPVASTYVNIIGAEIAWADLAALLEGSPAPWDGVALFVGMMEEGGPLPEGLARAKLRQVELDVKADPLHLNQGSFFDRAGRHIKVDPADAVH